MMSKSPKALALVTAPIAARVMGLSRRQFDRLVTAGVLPRGGQARRFDLLAVGPAYFRYLRDGKAESSAAAAARLKLLEAQRRLLEQRTREREGELVERAEVSRVFSSALVQIAAALEGMAGRLAGELAAVDQPARIHEVITHETRRIRESAAAGLEQLAVLDRGESPATSAEANGGGLG
jgi:hypothetical protein